MANETKKIQAKEGKEQKQGMIPTAKYTKAQRTRGLSSAYQSNLF